MPAYATRRYAEQVAALLEMNVDYVPKLTCQGTIPPTACPADAPSATCKTRSWPG